MKDQWQVTDKDSGLRRKGANQLALVTGTAVQQSQTDTTAGRLLKTGAFGMGGLLPLLVNPNVTDNTIAPGLYAYDVDRRLRCLLGSGLIDPEDEDYCECDF